MPMSQQLLRPRRPVAGAASITGFDLTLPTFQKFRGYRKTAGAQYYASPNLLLGDKLYFQDQGGAGKTAFHVSFLHQWNVDPRNAAYDGTRILGVFNAAFSRISWCPTFRTNGATSAMRIYIGTTDGSANVSKDFATLWNPTGYGAIWNRPCQHDFFYDGNGAGDDTLVLHYYFNCVKVATAAGSVLPAQIANIPTAQQGRFCIGSYGADQSICNIGLAAGRPGTGTEADRLAVVNAIWNDAHTLDLGQWPTAAKPLTEGYRCDDNMTGEGAAPSGTVKAMIGGSGYDLTPSGAPSSGLAIERSVCPVRGLVAIWGWEPKYPGGQRWFEPDWGPHPVDGRPCVLFKAIGDNPNNTNLHSNYAFADFPNAHTVCGSSGAFLVKHQMTKKGNSDVPLIGLYDHITNLGITANDTARIFMFSLFGGTPSYSTVLMGPATISLANPAVVTFEGHNLNTGDPVTFYDNGDVLPLPLSAHGYYSQVNLPAKQAATMFIRKLTNDTFTVHSSYANAQGNIQPYDTSASSQSGTHILYRCVMGNPISGNSAPNILLFERVGDHTTAIPSLAVARDTTSQGSETNAEYLGNNFVLPYNDGLWHTYEYANNGVVLPPSAIASNAEDNQVWECYVDNVRQRNWVDDGGRGLAAGDARASAWAASFGRLTMLGINAQISVVQGVTSIGYGDHEGYGRYLGINGAATPSQRLASRLAVGNL